MTEVGTIELWCVARDRQQRWKLELNIREPRRRLSPARRGSSASISGRPTRRSHGRDARGRDPHLRRPAARGARRDRASCRRCRRSSTFRATPNGKPALIAPALGRHARRRRRHLRARPGRARPGRQIASAKSWLANPSRRSHGSAAARGASRTGPRLSPVEASARTPGAPARRVEPRSAPDIGRSCPTRAAPIVLTVPASFDEEARELTVQAAQQAGLAHAITLLEEPIAALYSWIAAHRRDSCAGLCRTAPWCSSATSAAARPTSA